MTFGNINYGCAFRNNTLYELDSIAISEGNELAIAILNNIDNYTELALAEQLEKIENDINDSKFANDDEWEYGLGDAMEIFEFLDCGDIEWLKTKNTNRGYTMERYTIDGFDDTYHPYNHNVSISRRKYKCDTAFSNFTLNVSHGVGGELTHEIALDTSHISTAKKYAIEKLKQLMFNNNLQLALA